MLAQLLQCARCGALLRQPLQRCGTVPPPRRENTTQGSVLGKGDSTCSVRRSVAFPNLLSLPCWFPVRARGPRTWHGVPCRRGLLRVCEGVLDGGADAALRCRPYVVSHLAGSPVAFTPIRSIASHQSHTSPCAPRTPAPPPAPRGRWDQFFLSMGTMFAHVIDLSPSVTALHLSHSYGPVPSPKIPPPPPACNILCLHAAAAALVLVPTAALHALNFPQGMTSCTIV